MSRIGIDEPVTTDTKRLIRLPGSLHGSTGFAVTPISLDELKDFDPLDDAVIFSDKPVKVTVNRNIRIRLKGEEFDLEKGRYEVPEYLAVFLIGRGFGRYGY